MNTLISPLSVPMTKRKRFILNINNYRNVHYRDLHKAKISYFEQVKAQVLALKGWRSVSVRFTLYPSTRRKMDISNVCSIHDKFLMDALVRLKKLPDDDYRHVRDASYHFGCVDKGRGRVEVEFIGDDSR